MKKLRFVLPLLAILIVVAASAFTHREQPKATLTVQAWFEYDGVGDPADASSYTYTSMDPGCDDATHLCSIQATIDPATYDPNDLNTAKPLEQSSNSNDITLQNLAQESEDFTIPVEDRVEFRQ
ncbi:MAG: hypothetical protein JWP69_2190 [Flaviaesturariibacter sp.]|nr:hypothetical protein [Flaviaesturariibacter sp.]